MAYTYLQYENLPTWILTYFYYFQFKIASFFQISDQKAFGIALMVCLTTVYLFVVSIVALRVCWKTRGRRAQTIRGDSILLLGPCDSGKTAFFYMATEDKYPQTVTSIKENIASFTCASSRINNEGGDTTVKGKMVDFPGHPSLRAQITRHLSHTAGIVFMIDGCNYDVKEIAEFLYDVFVNPAFIEHPCPLLIAVNKSDEHPCADNQVVYQEIEHELDLIKESRGSMEAVGVSNTNQLGVEGQQFSFEKDAPCKVYACNCSVKNRDVQKITGFMSASLH